jgi:hypothetical protein
MTVIITLNVAHLFHWRITIFQHNSQHTNVFVAAWKWMFMNGCKCKSPIAIAMEKCINAIKDYVDK